MDAAEGANQAVEALVGALDRWDDALSRVHLRTRSSPANLMRSRPRKEQPLVALGLDRHFRILGSAHRGSFTDQARAVIGPQPEGAA